MADPEGWRVGWGDGKSKVAIGFLACSDTEGGGGSRGPDPPGKSQKYSIFFSNTGPYPLKIVKLSCQQSILGHNRHASETPFK